MLGDVLAEEGGQHSDQEQDSSQDHGLTQLSSDFPLGPGSWSLSAGLPGRTPVKSEHCEKKNRLRALRSALIACSTRKCAQEVGGLC